MQWHWWFINSIETVIIVVGICFSSGMLDWAAPALLSCCFASAASSGGPAPRCSRCRPLRCYCWRTCRAPDSCWTLFASYSASSSGHQAILINHIQLPLLTYSISLFGHNHHPSFWTLRSYYCFLCFRTFLLIICWILPASHSCHRTPRPSLRNPPLDFDNPQNFRLRSMDPFRYRYIMLYSSNTHHILLVNHSRQSFQASQDAIPLLWYIFSKASSYQLWLRVRPPIVPRKTLVYLQ